MGKITAPTRFEDLDEFIAENGETHEDTEGEKENDFI